MKQKYLGIEIDLSRDAYIPEQGMALLTGKGFYKKEHEDSPQKSIARAAVSFCFGDYELAQRIYDYASKQYFFFASPVISNSVEVKWPSYTKEEFQKAGQWLKRNVKPDGMPISCFLSKIGDTKESLVETRKEVSWLSMMGGGVGVYAGNRSPDVLSTGVMSHLRGYDADTLSYRQTSTRRGSMAAYMDIDHPEILSFIDMRNPIGGDPNKKCFNLNNAVNITDKFMEAVIKGEDYELVDPKHGSTGKFLSARSVWERILHTRFETGEPYINFIDTVNKARPEWITKPTYHVSQSNLCNEIHLMTSDKRTAVCCLSSLNLEKFPEWKSTKIVEDLTRFLDNVLEYFILLAPKELARAVHSASQERAIGIGTMGWHSYLQRQMIPFESGFSGAAGETGKIYSYIKNRAIKESRVLAKERGESEDCLGSGMRNSHLLAIAPNASSSSLVGCSPSIEPWAANAFVAQGRAGSFLIKNKHLEIVLEKKSLNTEEVWKGIISNGGSCQHIKELSEDERAVFKTAREINQMWVIELASIRQTFLCQGQSLNLFVSPESSFQEISDLHFSAWKKGVKGLYYLRNRVRERASVGVVKDEPLNKVTVKQSAEYDECLSCEG